MPIQRLKKLMKIGRVLGMVLNRKKSLQMAIGKRRIEEQNVLYTYTQCTLEIFIRRLYIVMLVHLLKSQTSHLKLGGHFFFSYK